MTRFLQITGTIFLLLIVLSVIIIYIEERRHQWNNGGENPSWAAEQFYESRVELVYEGQPITLSNGAVVRATHGYRNDIYGSYRIRDYSPPLFHVLEDGKILVVVTTSPRILRSQQGTEAIYDWWDVSEERINIYILDNGDRPERIELWAMYPGEADSTNRMQVKSVQTRVIDEDKRIWTAETIPWFAFEEKVIQAVEEKWGYGYQEAQIQWRPKTEYSLAFYSYELEAAKFRCGGHQSSCVRQNGMGLGDEEYNLLLNSNIKSGFSQLDAMLNRKEQASKLSTTRIYAPAKITNSCGSYSAPKLQLSDQPMIATTFIHSEEFKKICPNTEEDYVGYEYSVGEYEFLYSPRGQYKCSIDCSFNHEFVLVADVRLKRIFPSSFYRITRDGPAHFSEDYPIYMGE